MQKKKQYLIDLLRQLENNEILDENITLLESDFPFSEELLMRLFEIILHAIQEGKKQETQKIQTSIQILNAKIQQEIRRSQEEADELLHDIENLS